MSVKKQSVFIFVQARTGSSRFKGKVLMPLADKPLLSRLIERIRFSKYGKNIAVITTDIREDDPLVDLCRDEEILFYRGSEHDLLDRHYLAALNFDADIIVKIPSDCPLIDHRIIDKVLDYYFDKNNSYDFVSNLHPATYPDGNDVEVMPFKVLEQTWNKAKLHFQREHTTPYIWDNPDKFRIGNVVWETGFDYSMSHRFTIDYPEDYFFISRVYDELYDYKPDFSLNDILELLIQKPEIMKINEKYTGVNWYRKHLSQLKTVTQNQTKII